MSTDTCNWNVIAVNVRVGLCKSHVDHMNNASALRQNITRTDEKIVRFDIAMQISHLMQAVNPID